LGESNGADSAGRRRTKSAAQPRTRLASAGYEVVGATNADAGFELASTQEFDCLILDRMLPGRDGVDVLADLRRMGKTVPTLLLTARDAVEDRVAGLDARAEGHPLKP